MQTIDGIDATMAKEPPSAPMAQKDGSVKQAQSRAAIRYPFWFGGSASCFAACVTHPLDLGMSLLLPSFNSLY